eukprot:4490146-Amphidinium_carterae.2
MSVYRPFASVELELLLVGRPLPVCWLGVAMPDACLGAGARAVPCWARQLSQPFGRLVLEL